VITWALYRLMRRWLPDSHPWKLPIPYKWWMPHRTQLCRDFDFMLAISVGSLIIAILIVYFT